MFLNVDQSVQFGIHNSKKQNVFLSYLDKIHIGLSELFNSKLLPSVEKIKISN